MNKLIPDFSSKGTPLCQTVEDQNVFFGEMEYPHTEVAKELTAEAKTICDECSYKTECGIWALYHPEERGVWGGLSEADRRGLRRRLNITPVTESVAD